MGVDRGGGGFVTGGGVLSVGGGGGGGVVVWEEDWVVMRLPILFGKLFAELTLNNVLELLQDSG